MPSGLRGLERLDEWIASCALALMVTIALVEVLVRPLSGSGIENAPVLVQHLGLVMTMFGSVAALRHGHLSTFGTGFIPERHARLRSVSQSLARLFGALICGTLCIASWRLARSESEVAHHLAYGIPVWWFQATMPIGFLLLGMRMGAQSARERWQILAGGLLPVATGFVLGWYFDGVAIPIWPFLIALVASLLFGAPIFTVLGGLALVLFWQEALPIASVALSHYQITVNPSLPALPLFTLAGLVFARTGATKRLGAVFVALFGGGVTGTVIASAVLCSAFTAFTGGSGVTILALGGLLLPLLRNAGYPERRGISLVTSASALGVLLAPSVPLIMYAIIARVPINTMFLAGLVPACIMVFFLLVLGGFLAQKDTRSLAQSASSNSVPGPSIRTALWEAKWEILAPIAPIAALISGMATPTECAAVAAIYAVLTQTLAHRELGMQKLVRILSDCAQIIGGVMLILGMALGLTNYVIDAGVPDAAIEWVQSVIPNKWVFLLVLSFFLFAAGALMEIFAAIVVLVPLLLPVALSYGIDPIHFGIIFLANMELGFLCPPAGMNIYFASAMFNKSVRYVAGAIVPAAFAIFIGSIAIAFFPAASTFLPELLLGTSR
jgi:tripartite ATP-independent transporter DctM subunit